MILTIIAFIFLSIVILLAFGVALISILLTDENKADNNQEEE